MFKNKSLFISGISLIIAIVMMVSLCSVGFTASATETVDAWDGTKSSDIKGSGTEADPYLIETPEQLAYVAGTAGNSYAAKKYLKLTNDIYLNDTTKADWKDTAKEWVAGDVRFSGTLDGNGYTIHGLYITKTHSLNRYGLFAFVGAANSSSPNSMIKNIKFSNAYISIAEAVEGAGLVAGQASGAPSFEEIYVDETCVMNVPQGKGVAAIIARGPTSTYTGYTANIKNCVVLAQITGGTYVGALTGTFWRTGETIAATGNFSASNAPLFGQCTAAKEVSNNYALVEDSYNKNILASADMMKGAAAQTNMPNLDWNVFKVSKGYPVLSWMEAEAPEVPTDCEHETTKEVVIEAATYFATGLKNVVCADDACGAMVETDVVIPAADVALAGGFETAYADGKYTVSFDYSDALAADVADGAVIYFNYAIAGYNKTIALDGETGATVVLEGFNADRLNAELTYYLSAKYEGVDTAKLENVKETVKAADKADAAVKDFVAALENATEADVIEAEVNDTADFVENTIKLDVKNATATIRFVASDELVAKLAALGRDNREVTLVVTIGGNDYEVVVEDLRKATMVKISGLSFANMYDDISVKLVFDYADDANNFETVVTTFECDAIVDAADSALADAFVAIM